MRTTRLAPSPTGALHLGNARTFLINWLMARRNGWRILLRIEDLDGPRVRPGADRQAINDLRWLGLDWDEGPVYQSQRRTRYQQALGALAAGGHLYPCVCTRGDIARAASAPHAEDGSSVYPGTCRGRFASVEQAAQLSGRSPALRFAVPDRIVSFHDGIAGDVSHAVARDLGDFIVAKGDGTPAYQLAVVVDDLEAGVTDIVRGDDLLDSTPRQMLIYEALGASAAIPRYHHVPLVVGQDGRRLAKRHGDTRLSEYRRAGVPPSRVLALLARWCGLEIDPWRGRPADLLDRFHSVPPGRIVFTAADDRWLRAGAQSHEH